MRARRDIRQLLADEHGISIVFAMLLLVVLLILGGIIMSYGLAGYQRAQQDVTDERSYENVESAARFVYGQFANEADWTLGVLQQAQASSGAVDRTLSVSDGNFADVTVRVRHTGGISYDAVCFEKDAVDEDGKLTGVAYHFTVSYQVVGPDQTGAYMTIVNVNNLEKVGQ